MAVEGQSRWRTMSWVIPASIALHVLIVAIFFLPTAFRQPEPAPEESVSVELVPPPEEKPPEEKKPEAPKPPEPKPPEPKPEEKKPPEPKPPEKLPEPPKVDKPAEQSKAEEPPPPPPPKPPEPPKPSEAKPPEEKPPEEPKPEDKPKADDPDADKTQGQSLLQPLKPVFRFGDKDSGQKKSDGDSAEGDVKTDDAPKPDEAEADPAPVKPPPPQPDPADKPPVEKPGDVAGGKPAGDKADDKPTVDKPSENAATVAKPSGAGLMPPGINLPEVDAGDGLAEKNGAPGQATDDANVNFAGSLSPEQAKELADVVAQPPKPETRPAPPSAAEHLTKAKTLFSRSEGGDAVATMAMGDIPRGVRIGQLCATELREQLRHSSYPPEILPAYRLPAGNVMDIPRSQFRAAGQWYNLSFRCEVDGEGTRVMSFSYNIGEAVPRSEWRARGFPQD